MKISMNNIHKNQAGLVSFFVITIIMLVLTLIVLAFARLVNREQIQTLDRQLNAQAYYAAESAVNDVVNAFANDPSLAGGTYDDCNEFVTAPDPDLNSDLGNGISYSCLLVDPTPSRLEFSDVNQQTSRTTPLRTASGLPITALEIAWSDNSGGTGLTGCPSLGSYPANWNTEYPGCETGMLRLEVVPFNGPTSRQALITNRGVVFAQPQSAGGVASIGLSNINGEEQGRPVFANCSSGVCRLRITGVDLTGYLRMRTLYRDASVTITAYNGSTAQGLIGSQVEIDVTGKAADVLRRIKVNAQIPSADDGNPAPEFALQSRNALCKRFQTRPNSVSPVWSGAPGDDGYDACNPLD